MTCSNNRFWAEMDPKIFFFSFSFVVLKRNLCSHRLRMGEIIAPGQVRQFCWQMIPISANFTFWSGDLTFWDQYLTIFIFRKATSYTPPFILLPLGSFCYKVIKTKTTLAFSGLYLNHFWSLWLVQTIGFGVKWTQKSSFSLFHCSFEKKPLFSSLENVQNHST